jgi:putative transposase
MQSPIGLATSELFDFVPDGNGGHRLYLGKQGALGELSFTAHRPYRIPNSIVVSRQSGKWYVSFCYEDGQVLPDEAAVIAHYAALDEATLSHLTTGVVVNIMSHNGEAFVFSPAQVRNLERLEARRQDYERRMARCRKGSRRHTKVAHKIARHHAKAANTRREFSHQWSRQQADSATEVFVGEKLQIQNMVTGRQHRNRC